jgi:hypothetical protein
MVLIASPEAKVDFDVAADDPAEFLKLTTECLDANPRFWIGVAETSRLHSGFAIVSKVR